MWAHTFNQFTFSYTQAGDPGCIAVKINSYQEYFPAGITF